MMVGAVDVCGGSVVAALRAGVTFRRRAAGRLCVRRSGLK